MKLGDCLLLKDEIFSVDGRIRYFGVMDNRQGMVVSELRNQLDDHPGENQLLRDLTFFKGVMATWSLYFGSVRYAIVNHERFMIVMIPVAAGLVIITAESDLPLEMVERFSQLVRMQTRQLVSGKV